MPIWPTSVPDTNSVNAAIRERKLKADALKLRYIGERCVAHARNLPNPPSSFLVITSSGERKALPGHQPNYFDWTSNLRSSINFVIAIDGNVVEKSDFEVKGNGAAGAKIGEDYALRLAEGTTGVTLVVVAGMSYSGDVQRRGYDVTLSAELLAENLIKQLKLEATVKHL